MKLKNVIYDGSVIAISGVDSAYYPRNLIKQLINADIRDLTVIFNELNAENEGVSELTCDVVELIKTNKVTKLITSHLGSLSTEWEKYLDEVEILPMDILNFKIQAGANHIAGICVKKDYALLYRSEQWVRDHLVSGGEYVMEEAINADVSLVLADTIDPDNLHLAWNGTAFNCIDVARCGNMCFVEALKVDKLGYDDVDVPGQYVTGWIKSADDSFRKYNWK